MNEIAIDEKICLGVGPFFISFTNSCQLKHPYHLPEQMKLFIDNKGSKDKSDHFIFDIALRNSSHHMQAKFVAGTYGGPNPYDIHKLNQGDYLWRRIDNQGNTKMLYQIARDWSKWSLLEDRSGDYGISCLAELNYIFSYSILNKGGIMFHGVVMQWGNMGIIVCAHSGVGKTTHTRMWRDYENALILNGDRALCFREKGIWYSAGAPWSGSSGEQINQRTELTAIVILEQAKENKVTYLSPFTGAMELMQLTFAPNWEESLVGKSLDMINHIVSTIPVLKLSCLPNLQSVEVLKRELLNIRKDRYEICYATN